MLHPKRIHKKGSDPKGVAVQLRGDSLSWRRALLKRSNTLMVQTRAQGWNLHMSCKMFIPALWNGLTSVRVRSGTAALHAVWVNTCECACKAATLTTEYTKLFICWQCYICMTIAAASQKQGLQSTQPPRESADSNGTLLASNKEDSITCCRTWMTQERPQQIWSKTVPQNLSTHRLFAACSWCRLHSQIHKDNVKLTKVQGKLHSAR